MAPFGLFKARTCHLRSLEVGRGQLPLGVGGGNGLKSEPILLVDIFNTNFGPTLQTFAKKSDVVLI